MTRKKRNRKSVLLHHKQLHTITGGADDPAADKRTLTAGRFGEDPHGEFDGAVP